MTTKKTKEIEGLEVVSEELDLEIPTAGDLADVAWEDEGAVEALSVGDPDAKDDFYTSDDSDDEDDFSKLITTVDDDNEHLTWLLYGKNGTGKTTILSTVEGMLIIAADDGTLSIRDKVNKETTRKIVIDHWEKLEQIYWLLKKGTWSDEGVTISTRDGKFLVKSLGFDTITKLANVCMRSVVLGEKAKDASKDIVSPTQRDWGTMTQKMSYWLALFKEFPLQKVWLCQENATTDDFENEDFSVFPALSRALRTFVTAEADIIGRMYIKQVNKEGKSIPQFRLLATPNERFLTKDRSNKVGHVVNPRLDKLYGKVFSD